MIENRTPSREAYDAVCDKLRREQEKTALLLETLKMMPVLTQNKKAKEHIKNVIDQVGGAGL